MYTKYQTNNPKTMFEESGKIAKEKKIISK